MNPFDAASPFDARYYFADARLLRASCIPTFPRSAQVALPGPRRGGPGGDAGRSAASARRRRPRRSCGPANWSRREEVYEEERRIQHNIRALVNCIRNQVSPAARPYVHLFATSADIMDTARALCLVEVTRKVLLPDLEDLVRKLIALARAARRHAADGPHAWPARRADHLRLRRGPVRFAAGPAHRESSPGGPRTCAANSPGRSAPTTPCRCCPAPIPPQVEAALMTQAGPAAAGDFQPGDAAGIRRRLSSTP